MSTPRFASLNEAYEGVAEVTTRGITIVGLDETATHKSYAELVMTARRLATALAATANIRPGDRVILLFDTSFEFVEAFIALQLMGAIPVPCYPPPDLQRLEIALERLAQIAIVTGAIGCLADGRFKTLIGPALIERTRIRQVFTLAELAITDRAPAPWQRPAPSSTAIVQCSSGSTGRPKGVVLSHRAMMHHLAGVEDRMRPDVATDVAVSWLPLYHDLGLVAFLLSSICWGLPIVLLSPMSFVRRPELWLRTLHKYRGSITGGPPLGYALCVQRARLAEAEVLDLSSVRIALCGADWINLQILDDFAAKYAPHGFRADARAGCYGLAEATVGVTTGLSDGPLRAEILDARALERGDVLRVAAGAPASKVAVSAGVPLAGCGVLILDEAGRPAPDERVGQIAVTGGWLMDRYIDDEPATRAALDSGVLTTGDLGFLSRGELFVTGRVKDLIKIRGRNIYASDIEEVAEMVAGVRKAGAVAFAVYDERAGSEEVVVVCESTSPPDARAAIAAEVQTQVSERLELRVREVMIVDRAAIPKTPSGKKQRLLTRERYLSAELGRRRRWGRLAGLVVAARSITRGLLARVRRTSP